MLDRKSRHVLRAILKCQLDESEFVYVDYDHMRFLTVSDGSTPSDKIRSVSFGMSPGEVRSILRLLQELGHIQFGDAFSEYVSATHAGVTFPAARRKEILKTAVCSFLIPLVVSYITSAFSHYVEYGTHLHTVILDWLLSFFA